MERKGCECSSHLRIKFLFLLSSEKPPRVSLPGAAFSGADIKLGGTIAYSESDADSGVLTGKAAKGGTAACGGTGSFPNFV